MIDMGVYSNRFQGDARRALFVCSAAMLRSPTAAHVFSALGWNTRCAGVEPYAVQPLHPNTMAWADRVYCMTEAIAEDARLRFPAHAGKVRSLGIPDVYEYRQPELVKLLREAVHRVDAEDPPAVLRGGEAW